MKTDCTKRLGSQQWLRKRATEPMRDASTASSGFLAVCAVLNDLGCPDKLNFMMAGESLLNDGTAVVVVEYQPAGFPNGQPWGYYAPRLAGQAPPPGPLPMRGYHLARPKDVERFERFLVLRSALPDDARLLRELRARFGEPVVENFGYGLDVFLFE